MKLFGLGKSKATKKSPLDVVSDENLTGCLFYLQFNSKSLSISVSGKKGDYNCRIADIDEKKGVVFLTVLGRANIANGDKIKIQFDITQIIYNFTSTVKKNDSEYDLCIEYPTIISHFERRKNPRVVFRKNENLEMKLVTDLFSGNGVLGFLTNMGAGGFACSVQKIVEASTGKVLPMNPILLKPSTSFAIAQFELAGSGKFELSATSVHVAQLGYNMALGCKFGKLSFGQTSAIEKFVTKRSFEPSPPQYDAFYKKYLEEKAKPKEVETETEEDQSIVSEGAQMKSDAKTKANEPPKSAKAVKATTATKPPEAKESAEQPKPPKATPKPQPVNLMPTKLALIVLSNGLEIQKIKRILLEQNISNSVHVSNCEDALKLMSSKQFDFVFVDYNIQGKVSAPQLITVLHKHPKLKGTPIIVISDDLDVPGKIQLVSLKPTRVCFRPLKDANIVDTITKIMGE